MKRLEKEGENAPVVRYDAATMSVIVKEPNGKEKHIKASELRK